MVTQRCILSTAVIGCVLLATACSSAPPRSDPVSSSRRPEACALPAATSVLLAEGEPRTRESRLLQFWDLPNTSIWWSTADPGSSPYRDFRTKVRKIAGSTNPVRLLRRSPTHNNLLVASSASAWVSPASCLEKLLQGVQHERIDTFADPTEFVSFVLRSPDERTLRVYYYTVNQNGIGNMTPLTDPVKRDWRGGWRVLVALHSHPFFPSDPKLNGILAPSGPDAHFYMNFVRSAELAEARITNGLHTVRIPASAFARFRTEDH